MEDKRKRTLNFTSDEKSVLTELIVKYKDIVENKRSDTTSNAEKACGWKSLCKQFNAISTHCSRTPESLKTCWENIKRQTKKQSASRKREVFKTGGGRPPPPPPSTGVDSIVESILGPALEGLENQYDCDATLGIKGKENNATQSTSDDYTQIGFETEFLDSENDIVGLIVVEPEPTSSLTKSPIAQTNAEQDENNMKWEGWTPNTLKRPLTEVLKTDNIKNNSWVKRRRPIEQQSLSDQLAQEKICLVKTLIENSKEESKRRILILEEQLKQERIKTQKLL